MDMKIRIALPALLAGFLLLGGCGNNNNTSESQPVGQYATPSGTGYLYNSGPLQIVQLNGTYHDMGVQYGKLSGDGMKGLYDRLNASYHLTSSPETQAVV